MAYHEAGHAVMAHLGGMSIHRLSILPPAAPRAAAPLPTVGKTDDAARGRIAAVLGGEAAEFVRTGRRGSLPGSQDREVARDLARSVAGGEQHVKALLADEWEQAVVRLREPGTWSRVEAVAAALLRDKTIEGDALRALLSGSNV
jgi:ATP-dependent Zn protease